MSVIQAWKVEGNRLVGQTDGTRIPLSMPSMMRPDEIAPGVARLPKDEERGERVWADGVYEQKVDRFRRMGEREGLKRKRPPPISRWTQLRARAMIRWHRRRESRFERWHRDRMRDRYG